jgi:GNAT superfamily N-acetyltransferase
MTPILRIARAHAPEHLTAVLDLIADASAWLGGKHTDQWQNPWPDRTQRDERVKRGVDGGKTWIVWSKEQGRDEEVPVATVTIAKRANSAVWPRQVCREEKSKRTERGVYLHRLITARDYAGLGLGSDLIDWAGRRAAREYGAKWIRIDVWRDNLDLHKYYLGRGFDFVSECPDPGYPSSALFRKAIRDIDKSFSPQFTDTNTSPFS